MPIVSVIGSHFITDTHVDCTHSCRAILPHMVLHSCSRKAEMPSMCKGYWPDTLKMPGENNEHQACLVGEDRRRYRAPQSQRELFTFAQTFFPSTCNIEWTVNSIDR